MGVEPRRRRQQVPVSPSEARTDAMMFILSILYIHVQLVENRFSKTWPLFPIGHEDSLFHSRMIRSAERGRHLSEIEYPGNCCRRLRGLTLREHVVHGLTPTAKCCRRLGGCLEPWADARG